MRIPRYWQIGTFEGTGPEGNRIVYEAWGWSDSSENDALTKGKERAYQSFRQHLNPSKDHEYQYLVDQPLHEEVLDVISHQGTECALITRNRYGAQVLNTAHVLFVDIDVPEYTTRISMPKGFRYWFSAKYRAKYHAKYQDALNKAINLAEQQHITRIADWTVRHPDRSFRMYKTKAGFRLLFTDRTYDPEAPETDELFNDFGTDPLYRLLTRRQQCFRARLTPKPWRMDMHPPSSFRPTRNRENARIRQAWVQAYENKSKAYSVCQFIESFGPETLKGEICDIVQLHDQYCCTAATSLA